MNEKETLNLKNDNRLDLSEAEDNFLKIEKKYHEEGFTFDDPKFLQDCYERAVKILNIDTIDMDEFKHLYNVEKDKETIQRIEEKIKAKNIKEEEINVKIATIWEAILHELIEQACYLGDNITTKRTCKYDDLVNSIDDILEIESEGQHRTADHLAVVIDATFSQNIDKKIARIEKEINNGELGKLKYFESDFLEFKGEKTGIPKFILGIDRQNLESVTALWYENRGNLLAKHPLQIIILEEIIKQAQYFRDYAEKVKQPAVVEKYEKLYQIFVQIKKDREDELAEISSNEDNKTIINRDGVYGAIRNL